MREKGETMGEKRIKDAGTYSVTARTVYRVTVMDGPSGGSYALGSWRSLPRAIRAARAECAARYRDTTRVYVADADDADARPVYCAHNVGGRAIKVQS